MSVGLGAEISGCVPDRGVVVWWLGQAGLIVRSPDATVVLDPFLTDFGSFGRLYPPPCAPEELGAVDLVLGTHDHADHIDPEGLPRLLAASPAALAVVPAPVRERVVALAVDAERVIGASVGEPIERNGVRITPFAAAHAQVPEDGYGFHLTEDGQYPFLGYAIELDGVTICHTGDTLVYDGLAETLRALSPDLLVLPINGVSWFRERRGLAGNMNVFEAAELAAESGARYVMPVHWDLFADNTEDPEHFARYAARRHRGPQIVVPDLGTRFDLLPAS